MLLTVNICMLCSDLRACCMRADGDEVCRHWASGSGGAHPQEMGLPAGGGVLPSGGQGAQLRPLCLSPHGPLHPGGYDPIPGGLTPVVDLLIKVYSCVSW